MHNFQIMYILFTKNEHRNTNDWHKCQDWTNLFYLILKYYFLKKCVKGSGEMNQQLRALTALPEDLSSIPSTHMEIHNSL